MRPANQIVSVLSAFAVVAYFLFLAGEGVRAYFSPDDLMNLYLAWTKPTSTVLSANILFFADVFRPLGAVFYLAMYRLAGFDPLPFRLACYFLILLNFYLGYCLARRLTGSREIALLATLIGSYHARFVDLYYSTGTVYDLLCYSFFYGAFRYYVRIRQSGQFLSFRQAAACCALYVAALNSKEMAVTLPIFLAAYEWIYHSPLTITLRRFAAILVMVALTGIYCAAKTMGPGQITSNPEYRPAISVWQYFHAFQNYAGKLFYSEEFFDVWKGAALLAALVAVAWAMKSPHLKMSCVILAIGILPVAFITPRGGFVLYMPMLGWSIYGATLLVALRDAAIARNVQKVRFLAPIGQVLLFFLVLYGLGSIHRSNYDPNWMASSHNKLETSIETLRTIPAPRKGAKLLFLDDPFDKDEAWQFQGLAQLYYRDPELQVQTVKRMDPPPTPAQMAGYDFVFPHKPGI